MSQTTSYSRPHNDGRHPLFVIVMERESIDCNELSLPARFVMECGDHIPHTIRIRLPNGRAIHVYFEKRDKVFWSVSPLIKECKRLFGSTMICSYEGNGNFDVFVLKEDYCEVDYLPFRTKPRFPVCDQDTTDGVGWKFLLTATEDAINFGEMVLPGRFCRLFGKQIPESVSFQLSNGTMSIGRYLHEERQFNGLSKLFGLQIVEENDLLLFTYRGFGKFDIIVFDNGKVEKILDNNPNVPDATEIGTYGVADLDVTDAQLLSDAEVNQPDLLDNNAGIAMIEMNDEVIGFSAIMTKCNINNTSHGPYIPGHVNPRNREWIAGETVTFRNADRVWDIGVVYSGCLWRFSAGWNKFARDKEVKLNEMLVFNLLEGEGRLVFQIVFPGRG